MKHIPRRALLAASAAVLLGLAACGGGGSAASTDTAPIKVGIIADLTGATGDVGKPYNEGMMAYIDWLNAKGGIKGRKIEAMSNDYAYKVPTAEELYKKYVSEKAVNSFFSTSKPGISPSLLVPLASREARISSGSNWLAASSAVMVSGDWLPARK